jgi:hypothetical protein
MMRGPYSMSRPSALSALFLSLLFALAGCGGGSSGSPTSPQGTSPTAVPQTPAATTPAGTTPPLAAGVQGAAPSPGTQAPSSNVVPVTFGGGPTNSPNLPHVSVTICVPGTSNCQTVNNILVDTGSIGLRIFASVLQGSANLPLQGSSDGRALGECTQFADGFTWGPVRMADVRIGGEEARNLPVNILGDPSFNQVPADCASGGSDINSVNRFASNGVLGVGLFVEDCGPGCARPGNDLGYYYACSSGCDPTSVPLGAQVRNPVASFATNNNGVMLSFAALPAPGARQFSGTMTFGIGTQANNGLGTATVITPDPRTGYMTTLYQNRTFTRGFIDSGSNGVFFRDTSIPLCRTSFYCPASTLTLSATNVGANGARSTVPFNVVNAEQVFVQDPDVVTVPGLSGSVQDNNTFDWGLPFFLGRNVYTAIEGRATPGGNGPFYAY